jgi:hypothetical protein
MDSIVAFGMTLAELDFQNQRFLFENTFGQAASNLNHK